MSLLDLANWIGLTVAAICGLSVLYGQVHYPVLLNDRQAVKVFGVIWTAVLLLEFYALGPASYISWNVDGNMGPTYYTYLNDRHLGGQLVHAYGGGHDADAVVGFGTQYFSLEGILFFLLPTWLAILASKICVTVVGFSGTYKLCRVAGSFNRTLAAGMAALFTLTLFYHIDAATWHGLGYSVLPWVIYLGVVRDQRRYYLSGLLALGIMTSMTEPTHTFLAAAASLVAGAVLLGKVSFRTLILPLVVICIFMVANWHEVFYALKQIAPLTFRGTLNLGDQTLVGAIAQAFFLFPTLHALTATAMLSMVGVAASILVLGYRKDPFFWYTMRAIATLLACFVALVWLPWDLVGLGIVKGLTPEYLFFAHSVIFLLVAGKAVQLLEAGGGGNLGFMWLDRRWPTAFVIAFGAAILISHKVENITRYVYYGGQSQYSTIENLANPDWSAPEPFRVITLRHQRPDPELAAAFYGLDTYDGMLKLTPKAFSIYWRDGILKGKGIEGIISRLTMERRYFSGPAYNIDNQADLSLLGVANVAFIISPVPMKGGVRLVSGPDKPSARVGNSLMTFFADRLPRIIRYGKVYVYALADSLPRAFAARAIHRVGVDVNDAIFLKTISNLAPTRTAVVREAPKTFSYDGNLEIMRVTDVTKTVNGYDVVVDAPDGGVLVLNVPPMPFWTAVSGAGKLLKITPVNMIHMAVTVPEGAKLVSFRYRRPTVRSAVRKIFR